MIFSRFRLMKRCFPRSWIRKLPLLLFPADTIVRDGRTVALCTTFRRRIILLCVDAACRRQGLASVLIQRSTAVRTDTYVENAAALEVWLKNGFVVDYTRDTPFGKKYELVRQERGRIG